MRSTLICTLLLAFNLTHAASGITYHGRIIRASDNSPVTSAATEFHIKIKSPGAEGCLMWEEYQTKDLSLTSGAFSITIGDTDALNRVQVNVPNPNTGGNFTLPQVFSNRGQYLSGLTCDDASGTYIPATTHGRTFAISFRENSGAPWEEIPPASINYVPLSYNTIQLEGYRASEFLKIDPLAVYTPLTSGQVNTLVDIIAGTNTQYLRPATTFGGDVSGTYNAISVNRIRGTNVVATAPTLNQVLKFDGTNWVPSADDTGGTPGDASYAAKGLVQLDTDLAVSGLTITGGVLSMPAVGTAGTYGSASSIPVITTDAKGRVTGVAATTVDDTSKLPLNGGTMLGAINMGTQNITNATSVAATNFSGRNFVFNDNDTNTATVRAAPDFTTNYTLTLPTGAPQAGYVLSTDGAGQLSWIAAASGSMTGISSTNLYLTVDSTTPATPTLTVNVGTAANTVAAGNDARITGALQEADYNAQVLPAASCTTSQTSYYNSVGGVWACQNISVANFSGNLSGDVTGTQGATVVERIRGTNVVATAPTPNQVLKFDGTNWVPSPDAGLTAETDPGVQAWAKQAPNAIFSTAGNELNITSRIPSAAAAPIAGQDGQTLRWNNTSGLWEWFTPGVAGSGFTQGGNTFGANGVLGTNDNFGLEFETNGSTRMTILNSGNVGIGTATPAYSLDVLTEIRTRAGLGVQNGAGNIFWTYSPSVNVMSMGGVGANPVAGPLNITNTGFVGIGTNGPSTLLDINGAVTQRGMAAPGLSPAGQGRIYFSTAENKFKVSQNGGAYTDLVASGGITSLNGETGSAQTFAVDALGTEPEINSAADVHTLSIPLASGAGVTSGTISKLDYDDFVAKLTSPLTTKGDLIVHNGTTEIRLPAGTNSYILSANSATASGLEWIVAPTGDITEIVAGNGLTGDATSGVATLAVGAGAGIIANANDVAVDVGLGASKIPQVGGAPLGANGVVVANGLGTALTSLNCLVNQVIKFDASGFAYCGTDDTAGAGAILNGGNTFAAAATIGTNDNFALNFETNGSTQMTILPNGNVGIGETNPTQKLRVAGEVRPDNMFIYRWTNSSQNMIELSSENGSNGAIQKGLFANLDWGAAADGASALYGGHLTLDLYPTGTMGNAVGLQTEINATSGTVTNAYGLRSSVTSSGVVTNAYGVHVGNVQGSTSRYSIYTTDSGAPVSIASAFDQRGMAAPGLSPAGQGRIYFSTAENKFKVSQNGGAYVDMIGSGGVTGTGTTNYLPKWSSATGLGDSIIQEVTGQIGIGGAPVGGNILTVVGGDILVDDVTVGRGPNGDATSTALGVGALLSISTGYGNTAIGTGSLSALTSQWENVGLGVNTGSELTSGTNTALGALALSIGSGSGGGNTAVGARALYVAAGHTGGGNTVIGMNAATNLTSGSENIIIGRNVNAPSATADYQLNIGDLILGSTAAASRMVDINGSANIRGLASAPSLSATDNGKIYFDSALNKFRVSENGGAYTDLVGGGGVTGTGTTNFIPKWSSATGLTDSIIEEDGTDLLIDGMTVGYGPNADNLSVAVGSNALVSVTSGYANVGVGSGALSSVSTHYENVGVGLGAGGGLSGNFNTVMGSYALSDTSTGSNNIVIGARALDVAGGHTGSSNTIIGAWSAQNLTTGDSNIIIGQGVNAPSATGDYQLNIGDLILGSTAAASRMVDINGSANIRGLASAPSLSAVDNGKIYFDSALNKFRVSENNGAYVDLVGGAGATTIDALTDAISNAGLSNLFLGTGVGALASGASNTGVGLDSMQSLTTGTNNVAVGRESMYSTTTGSNNTVVGMYALPAHVSGDGNTAIGGATLSSLTAGASNTAIGVESLKRVVTGTDNTALGFRAGENANGASGYNIFIGRETGPAAPAAITDTLWIHNAPGNPTIYGDLFNRRVGLGGMTDPTTTLDINGAVTQRGMADPGLSPAGQGRIYFSTAENKFKVSQNGGAYADLVSAAAGDITNGGNSFGAAATIGTNDNYDLNFETNGTTRMTILNSGYVGIGTASAPTPLTVDRTAAGAQDVLTISNQGAAASWSGPVMSFAGVSGYQMAQLSAHWDGNTNNANFSINTRSAGVLRESMRIYHDGGTFIGSGDIGSLTNVSRANVMNSSTAGNSVGDSLTLLHHDSNSAASNGIGNRISFVTETNSEGVYAQTASIEGVLDAAANNAKNGSLRFFTLGPNATAGSNAASEKMRILADGSVGIGITTPATALDVNGAFSMRGMAAPATSVAGRGRIYYDSTSNKFRVSENNGAYVDLVGGAGATTIDALTDAISNAGLSNLFLGTGVGALASGGSNTGVGLESMQSLTTGTNNVAVGREAMYSTTTGSNNTVVGMYALPSHVSGDDNTVVGGAALSSLTAGTANTAIGLHALRQVATGTDNTALGYKAGENANGASGYNIFLGRQTGPAAATALTDTMWIHNGPGNPTIYGDMSTRRIGLGGMTDPSTTLDIAGAVTQRGMAAPGLSSAGQGRIYFDSTSNKFRVSQNGGAYTDLVGGGSGDIANGGNSFGAAATIGTNDNYNFNFETNGSTRMTIKNDGNVGIGTTNPTANLEFGGTADSSILFNPTSGSVNWRIGTEYTNSYLTVARDGIDYMALFDVDGDMYLHSRGGLPLYLNESGNNVIIGGAATSNRLGIYTASPSYPISLGGSAARTIGMENHPTASTAGNNLTVLAGGASGGSNRTGGNLLLSSGRSTGNVSSNIQFQTPTPGGTGSTVRAPSTKMTLDGNGFLGIGTPTPAAALHVVGDLVVDDGNVNKLGGISVDQSISTMYIGQNNNGAQTILELVAGEQFGVIYDGFYQMHIDYNGNTGIGVSGATTKLQVAGVISPSVDATHDLGTTALRFKDVYASGSVINTSDARMKKNIQNSDLGLNFINQLRPVFYEWKSGQDTKSHYGLIAQETEAALIAEKQKRDPAGDFKNVIVNHDLKNDRYGIRYSELIAPIIKAIQEISASVQSLLHQVDSHEQELQDLRQQNQMMKSYLCAKDPSAPFCE